ncbi:hypothetical protein GE061_001657 [Apolygus lucorum]|uniref:FLYWCH-type domain-containing protein n=1 Tax=Apolygus lucorum TaxID=248454 RepID=A0A6A4JP91_APOLU|nr:hypothetical protein GE061_001657 [Apolygus lucorum]
MLIVLNGQRANSVLYVDDTSDLVYWIDRKRNGTWYMKCNHASCPGRAKIRSMPLEIADDFDFSETLMVQTKDHNHSPEAYLKQVKELKETILKVCASESGDMHQIFKKECAKVPVEIASKLEWAKFYYSMRKVRKSQLPAVPTTISGLHDAIRTVMPRFGMVGGIEFYHGVVEAAGKTSCMFVTKQLVPVLRASALWHVDGTFKTVPRQPPGKQLVTIMANDGDKVYPVVYVIMPCKEDSYVAVFENLKNEFGLSPPAVMSD